MNKLLVVLAFVFLIRKSVPESIGNCEVADDDKIEWTAGFFTNEAINDVDGLNLTFPFTGNLTVETSNNKDTGADYLEVTTEGDNLVFKTNDYFDNDFEQNERFLNPTELTTLVRTVTLKCDGDQKVFTFIQPVIDTNNHKPTFKSTSYSYTLPSPLLPKLDLSSVGDAITVEDIDFSNKNIAFHVDPPGTFTIETIPEDDKRTYRGFLKVTKYTTFSSQITLKVTATDTGDPTSTSDPVTITIDVDSEDSMPNPPTFSAAVYRFQYSTANGSPSVVSSDGKKITITSTDPENIVVDIDNADFKATYDPSSDIVSLEYKGTGIGITTDPVLILTLTATLNGKQVDSSKATILVDVPSVVSIPPFNRAYYTATYHSNTTPHTVTLDQEIIVTENATISLENVSGDSDPNFEIVYIDSKWQLNVSENLGDEVLKEGGEKILTLHASMTQGTETSDAYATLVVWLPVVEEIKSPRFGSPLYTAKYEIVDGKGSVTLNEDIVATSDNQTVNVTLRDPSVNFDIEKSGDKWTVKVLNDLSPEDLIAGTEYVLTLEATIPGQDDVEPAYSVLIIVPTTVPVPSFPKMYYTATYQVSNDIATVEISNGPIEINPGIYETSDIVVTLEGDYRDQFSIVLDNSVYNINVTGALNQTVLDQGGDIVLTVEATAGDSTVSTLLIITLPIQEALQFSKSYYTAWYTVENGIVNFSSDTISVTSSQDQEITVDFEEATTNFSVTKHGHNTWSLSTEKYLTDDDLEEHDLILTLKATAPGSVAGKSTLIIHLPYNCSSN